jgi:lipid II:glycine glycyltransferase (peptidoglycan interpeptide bridge formation enzyme)
VPESLAPGRGKGELRLAETVIHTLAAWREENLDGDVRYEIRRSRREGVTIRPVSLSDARFMFESYRDTVKRHEGRLRYTQPYFEALCQFSQTPPPGISGLIAETSERMPCGFLVTAQSGADAYYLHAAFDHAQASGRPSYALLCAAITQARNNGSRCFNLMASPVNQPALVRFKEKWGGQTGPLLNFDIPISRLGHLARLGLQLRQRLFFPRRN